MKKIVVKLPQETVAALTTLAGGRNHRAAYITNLLPILMLGPKYFREYLGIKAKWVGKQLENAELQQIELRLTPKTIELLDRLSGGQYYYNPYLTALVEKAAWMPAIVQASLPKISAPRPNRSKKSKTPTGRSGGSAKLRSERIQNV